MIRFVLDVYGDYYTEATWICEPHRYRKSLNRLLKVCYVPATSADLIAFFFSFLLRPLTVLMKQTRQPVHAVKQSIYLDVYGLALWLCLLFWSGGMPVLLACPKVMSLWPS